MLTSALQMLTKHGSIIHSVVSSAAVCWPPVQVQQIWVSLLHPHPTNPFTVRASPVLVQLLEQDLCSVVSIGDVVHVVGQASLTSQTDKPNSRLLGDLQVCGQPYQCACLTVLADASGVHVACTQHNSLLLVSKHTEDSVCCCNLSAPVCSVLTGGRTQAVVHSCEHTLRMSHSSIL